MDKEIVKTAGAEGSDVTKRGNVKKENKKQRYMKIKLMTLQRERKTRNVVDKRENSRIRAEWQDRRKKKESDRSRR